MTLSRSLCAIASAFLPILVVAGAEAAPAPLPANLLAMHQRSVDDGECMPLDQINAAPLIATLSPTDTLYVLPCSYGIVNAPSRLYDVATGDRPGVRALEFAQFDGDYGWIADDQQFNVSFDQKTLTLTAREYYDVAGDCGADGTWVWKDYAFALLTYRYQGACDHTRAFKDWPTVWQLPAPGAAASPQNGVPNFVQSPQSP